MFRTILPILRKVKQELTRISLSAIATCSFPLVSLVGLYRNLQISVPFLKHICCGRQLEEKSQRKAIRDIFGVDPWYAVHAAGTGLMYVSFIAAAAIVDMDADRISIAQTSVPCLTMIGFAQGCAILGIDNIYYSWLNDVTRFFLGINQRDWFGNTVLHRRVNAQDFVEVRDLIERGANLSIRNNTEDVNAEAKTVLEISEDLTKSQDVYPRKAFLIFQSLKKAVESQILNIYRRDAKAFSKALHCYTQAALIPDIGRIVYDYHFGETLENLVESFAPNHRELRGTLYRKSSALLFSQGLNQNLSTENLRDSRAAISSESKNSIDAKMPEEKSGTVVISIALPMS